MSRVKGETAVCEGGRGSGLDVRRFRLTAIEGRLAETATRDLLLRVPRSFEGQVEIAELRTQLLRETLEARIKAAETRLDALERV